MIHCFKCGADLPDNMLYCLHCGSILDAEPETVVRTRPKASAAPTQSQTVAIWAADTVRGWAFFLLILISSLIVLWIAASIVSPR